MGLLRMYAKPGLLGLLGTDSDLNSGKFERVRKETRAEAVMGWTTT